MNIHRCDLIYEKGVKLWDHQFLSLCLNRIMLEQKKVNNHLNKNLFFYLYVNHALDPGLMPMSLVVYVHVQKTGISINI